MKQCDALGNVLQTPGLQECGAAEPGRPAEAAIFPDVCGLARQDIAPWHKAKPVQEWFAEL